MDKYETRLNDETSLYAAEVLREDCNTRDEEITKIREWIATKPDLRAKTGDF